MTNALAPSSNPPGRAPGRASGRGLLEVLWRPRVARLFVHDNTAVRVPSYEARLGASAHALAERALVMARPGDVVAVAQAVDEGYLDYLADLGLGPRRGDVVAVSGEGVAQQSLTCSLEQEAVLELLARHLGTTREVRISPYYASAAAFGLAPLLERRLGARVVVEGGETAAVELANGKDRVREAALRLGVPVAPGEVVCWEPAAPPDAAVTALLAAARRQARATGRVIIRGVRALLGSDNLVLESGALDPTHLRRWLAARAAQHVYLVEACLPITASPNLQLWIEDDATVRCVSATAQRLDPQLSYAGSRFPHITPLAEAMEDSAIRMARWLADEGFRGPLGLDFIESPSHGGGTEHRLVEVNGRINGATYALALAASVGRRRRAQGRSPLPAWTLVSGQAVAVEDFSQLARALGDLLYHHAGGEGVLPYNTGMLRYGSVSLLALGTDTEAAAAVEAAARERLAALRGAAS